MAKAGKTVPLSSLLWPDPTSFGEHFGLLRGPEDWATLINLRGRGRPSKETRENVKAFIEDRARKASARLKRNLGLKPGRPRDLDQRKVWRVAAALREKNPKQYTWSRLALKLDARAYSIDPRGAMDRMRHGVGAVLKDRRGKGKSA